MSPRAIRLLVGSNIVLLGTTAVLVLSGFRNASHPRFDQIDVERLNVIGKDGKPVLVLARSGLVPGPRANGKDYDAAIIDGRELMSGMLFFNDVGDEVGSILWAGIDKQPGHSQVVHLSMDQWKQNQTVALQNVDNGTSRRAGLQINDQPVDVPVARMLDRLAAMRGATGARLDSMQAAHRALMRAGEGGRPRAFLGSRDREAMVELRDTAGRVRARLLVGIDDLPRLEFLDATGKVTAVYPR
jgi:hypothetical protein